MCSLTTDPESYVINDTKQVRDDATCVPKDSHSALGATGRGHLPPRVLLGEKRRRSPLGLAQTQIAGPTPVRVRLRSSGTRPENSHL